MRCAGVKKPVSCLVGCHRFLWCGFGSHSSSTRAARVSQRMRAGCRVLLSSHNPSSMRPAQLHASYFMDVSISVLPTTGPSNKCALSLSADIVNVARRDPQNKQLDFVGPDSDPRTAGNRLATTLQELDPQPRKQFPWQPGRAFHSHWCRRHSNPRT
ncbi:hypothetical protein K437DRAFT_115452 [Tilletiaria anomala UBC 951]|uniref:Uncharacterized protein n=1 Tax=Tilletiaria anomala (strain ATCC 24038 / CBS 436.72 / UBC 951) TaxID=1037660 RepID=A0A066WR04_TILAU|nr:uncharacterized protein K437DRAFT_115452 [Tilletiaria anomala UBC 951]KDN53075.1 hypothetical protein K437DRAFT_115452 [Tilletiaria anomala UBC 951]